MWWNSKKYMLIFCKMQCNFYQMSLILVRPYFYRYPRYQFLAEFLLKLRSFLWIWFSDAHVLTNMLKILNCFGRFSFSLALSKKTQTFVLCYMWITHTVSLACLRVLRSSHKMQFSFYESLSWKVYMFVKLGT